MKKIVTLLSFVLLFCFTSFGQSNPSLEKSIQLLQIMDQEKTLLSVIDQMMTAFKGSIDNVPDEFWAEFKREIDAKELINMTAEIYAKHFTAQELDELIAFYKTPIGKKYIEKLPLITSESMEKGQAWGSNLGQKVMQSLIEKGLIKD